ncbi:MAG: 3-dehydroquinate synthase [Lachnospiraceae bacterium]|nr:3-dehydroquinate synthase [Lachnospiraceae bacterium]
MTERLTVHENQIPIYDIVIEENFERLEEEVKKLNVSEKRLCIVTETNVGPLYGDKIKELLEKCAKEVYIFTFEAGEKNKNLDTVKDLYIFLIEHQFDRKDMLIALGGGVTGDLTGYTAATYLRGIDFIQIPTSLLAQVDSSVGGKTGVDFDGYKNMVGAFYQPKLVYIATNTLESLTEQEFLSGMGEVIKYGVIKDKEFFYYLKEHVQEIRAHEKDALSYIIKVSCDTKRKVVENDFKEQGERALLNMGHTLGHAIEKYVYMYRLHGECVAIGMAGSAFISYKKGYIPKDSMNEIIDLLKAYDLPVSENRIDLDNVIHATYSDKKMESGKIKFVVVNEIGTASIDRSVNWMEMKEALDCILAGEYNDK